MGTKASVSSVSVFASDLLVQLCPDGAPVGVQGEVAAATIDASPPSLSGTDAPSESTRRIGFRDTKI
jgi:hypothetical protein